MGSPEISIHTCKFDVDSGTFDENYSLISAHFHHRLDCNPTQTDVVIISINGGKFGWRLRNRLLLRSSCRWNHQLVFSHPIHLLFCTRQWWPHQSHHHSCNILRAPHLFPTYGLVSDWANSRRCSRRASAQRRLRII